MESTIHKTELAALINKLAGKEIVKDIRVASPAKNLVTIVLPTSEVVEEAVVEQKKEAEEKQAEAPKEVSAPKDEETVKESAPEKKPTRKRSSKKDSE